MKLLALKCIWQEKSANANIQTPRGQRAHRWKYDSARTQFSCLTPGLEEKTEACRKDFTPRSKWTQYSGVTKFMCKLQSLQKSWHCFKPQHKISRAETTAHFFKNSHLLNNTYHQLCSQMSRQQAKQVIFRSPAKGHLLIHEWVLRRPKPKRQDRPSSGQWLQGQTASRGECRGPHRKRDERQRVVNTDPLLLREKQPQAGMLMVVGAFLMVRMARGLVWIKNGRGA